MRCLYYEPKFTPASSQQPLVGEPEVLHLKSLLGVGGSGHQQQKRVDVHPLQSAKLSKSIDQTAYLTYNDKPLINKLG